MFVKHRELLGLRLRHSFSSFIAFAGFCFWLCWILI